MSTQSSDRKRSIMMIWCDISRRKINIINTFYSYRPLDIIEQLMLSSQRQWKELLSFLSAFKEEYCHYDGIEKEKFVLIDCESKYAKIGETSMMRKSYIILRPPGCAFPAGARFWLSDSENCFSTLSYALEATSKANSHLEADCSKSPLSA